MKCIKSLIALGTLGLILQGCSSGGSSDEAKAKAMSEAQKKTIVNIYSNSSSFAAVTGEGRVITWGFPKNGGDSSKVKDQLQSGVVTIVSNANSYAAIKVDGSVVTWGDASTGGDSSSVSGQLKSGVKKIISNLYTFAAIKTDGSVVIWGKPGDKTIEPSGVADKLKSNVVDISATRYSYAALKNDGSVVYWGSESEQYEVLFASVSAKLQSGVRRVYVNSSAFAALKDDGSVVTWGSKRSAGGDSSKVAAELQSGVVTIVASLKCFAALKADGSVVSWGNDDADTSRVAGELKSGVKQIFAHQSAFAALKNDGSVVAWGNWMNGGSPYSLDKETVKSVTQIFPSGQAFVAQRADGSLVAWGGAGGNTKDVASKLTSGIKQVVTQYDNYSIANSSDGDDLDMLSIVVLKDDGSVVSWGGKEKPSQFSTPKIDFVDVSSKLQSGVSKIYSNPSAYVAVKDDGTVVTWGDELYGGNSDDVFGVKNETAVEPICPMLAFNSEYRNTVRESKQSDPACLRLDVSIKLQMASMQSEYERMISTGFGSRPNIPGQFRGATKRHRECSDKIIAEYKTNETKCKLSESLYQFERTSTNYIQEMSRFENDF